MDELLGIIGYYTGELVLYGITFGRHKPNWKSGNYSAIHELDLQRSTWLGWIVWGAIFLLVAWLISL